MGSSKIMSWLFILGVFLLSHFDVVKGARSLLNEEDLEIETQLKILNKPSVKTIYTKWGDIHDCIDINKQPAFDHPLLKNHTIQMEPSFFVKSSKSSTTNTRDDACPKGTVPIRRTTKEDLVRARSQRETSAPIINGLTTPSGQRRVGISLSKDGEKYYGTSAHISIFNPYVNNDQFSSAEMAIETGEYAQAEINAIRIGWTVNPELYGDHNTRLFSQWTVDGYQKTGCYNTLCSGFIQVDPHFTTSSPPANISTYGGDQYSIYLQVNQDTVTGNWWLLASQPVINIGYWPKELFPSLSKGGASRIFWGGAVKDGASQVSPPMGSGHVPDDDKKHSCHFNYIKYVNGANAFENPEASHVVKINDCNNPDTKYEQVYTPNDKYWEHALYVGGPGGPCA